MWCLYTYIWEVKLIKVLYPQCETIVKYEQETGRKKGTVKSYFINMIVKLSYKNTF